MAFETFLENVQRLLKETVGRNESSGTTHVKICGVLRGIAVGSPIRIVIVRHGESTYNIQNRAQGRLDASELTESGLRQAALTGKALAGLKFDRAYVSPLRRAQQTAQAIVAHHPDLTLTTTENLFEINLPTWEGLTFTDIKTRFPEAYAQWRYEPHNLAIDGYYPVRDLWAQAAVFWQQVQTDGEADTILIVGHSGINRALMSTALQLPLTGYHRLGQNNCAINVLNFPQGWEAAPQLESLNQTCHLGNVVPPRSDGFRLLLVRHGETDWNREQRFQGQRDIPLNAAGEAQAAKAGEFLKNVTLDHAFVSPLQRPYQTAIAIANHHPDLAFTAMPDLQEISHGLWEGLYASEIEAKFPGQLEQWLMQPETVQMPEGESLADVWARVQTAWQQIIETMQQQYPDGTGLVVAHDAVNKAIICQILGLDPAAFWHFKQGNGAVTVIDYSDYGKQPPVLRSLNITTHLGGVIDCTAAGAL